MYNRVTIINNEILSACDMDCPDSRTPTTEEEEILANGLEYKIVEGYAVQDHDKQEQRKLDSLRFKRKTECFSVINRGSLWYDQVTAAQKEELGDWYRAWLDVTLTKTIPEKPAWLE